MRRKVFAAVVLSLILMLAVSASADFGGFSGRSSRSSSRSRHSTSSQHIKEGSVEYKFYQVMAVIGCSLLAIIAGEIVYIGVDALLRHRRIAKYCAAHPDFDREAFEKYVEGLYCNMQVVWQNKDITPLSDAMTEEFFTHMDGVLYPFREKHQTDHTEQIEIQGCRLCDAREKDGVDCLSIYLVAKIVSYVTDDETGRVISGDNRNKIKMTYDIKFSRKSGVVGDSGWRVCEMNGEKVR